MPTAGHRRFQRRSFLYEQRSDALWTVNLVRRHGIQVDFQLAHVDGDFASRLHTVGVKVDVGLIRNGSDFRNRLNRSNFIVRVHYRNQNGVRPYRSDYVVRIDKPIAGNGQPRHFISLLLEIAARMKNSMVFDFGSDDVPALRAERFGNTANSEVVGFCTTAHKDDLRNFGVDEFRDLLSRVID